MSRIFSADSAPMLFLSKFLDILILSVLFWLCCIPIVTIGPALSALYYTTRKVISKKEGYLFKSFFHSLRVNLGQGILAWIILLAVEVLMMVNILFSGSNFQGTFRVVMMAIYFAILFVALMISGYLFPTLAQFDCKGKQLFRNAISLAVTYPGRTILMLLLQIVFYLLMAVSFAALPILLFFLPVVYAALQRAILEKIFLQYMEEEDE